MGYLAPAARIVGYALAEAMEPPPPPDLVRWAEQNVVFDARSPLPGPFRIARFPFYGEILEVLSPEHPCREVTLRGSAQIGKTQSVILPTLGAWFEYGPLDALVVHPTGSSAKEWNRTKWKPMRRTAPALRRIFGSGAAEGSDTIFDQETLDLDGSLKIASAGSPSDLTGTTRRLVLMDDTAKYEMTGMGDPESLAESRASGFDEAKILRSSTALIKGTCRITRAYERSDMRVYVVPCPHCGHEAPLEWENFKTSIDPERLHAAHFTCEACGAAIEHKDKERIVALGHWRATNPRGDHPGFHLWRAYVPHRDWASIAVDYAKAMGWTAVSAGDTVQDATKQGPEAETEQTFWNDVLGLPFAQASMAPPWEAIRDRVEKAEETEGYDRGRIPQAGVILTAGVDCQGDRTEVHVKAFGRQARSWTIDYLVIPHHIADDECWQTLDGVLKQRWRMPGGKSFPLDMLAIDGNAYTGDVWAWAKRHPWSRVIIVRGSNSANGPAYALQQFERRADGKTKRRQKRAYNVNVSMLKAEFYAHLAKSDPLERGWCGFARGLGDEFYRQITAETRVLVRNRHGVTEARWNLVEPSRRNEGLDTEVYARMAAMRQGWRSLSDEQWERLEAAQAEAVEEPQGDLFDGDSIGATAARLHEALSELAKTKPDAPERRGRSLAERLA